MTKKKSGFWTFCFSFIPGAGEMYMGFMKMGLSLMGLMIVIPLLAVWLNMDELLIFEALIWFYSFFHVHNLRAMDDEDFYALEDTYLFHISDMPEFPVDLAKRYQKIIGAGLVLLGFSMLWRNIWNMTAYLLPDFLRQMVNNITYRLPQMVFAVVIIWLGLLMIRGKKQEVFQEDPARRGSLTDSAGGDMRGEE